MLDHAARAGLCDERLVSLARSEFTRPGEIGAVSSALVYLQTTAPWLCSKLLEDLPAVDRVAGRLGAASDLQWTGFVERFDPPADPGVLPAVTRLAVAKAGLIVLKADQVRESERAREGYFPSNGMIVGNPLLVVLSRGGRAEEGREVVRLTSANGGQPVVVIGDLATPEPTYRAYGLWLAAEPFRKDRPPVAELFGGLRILNGLFSGNDALARGAASVCAAVCPP